MADLVRNEVPMLLETKQPSVELVESKLQRLISRTRSESISIPMSSMEPYEGETSLVGHTGPLRSERKTPFVQMSGPLHVTNRHGNLSRQNVNATGNKAVESMTEKIALHGRVGNDWQNNYAHKNEHLLRSGQLGMCNDPYCTTCPTYFKTSQQRNPKASGLFDPKFHNALYGDAKGCARRFISFLSSYVPGVMNPHTKIVQHWSKFFAISCIVAIFVDPLFFFLLGVKQEKRCIFIDWKLAWALVCVRSINDFVCFLNMLLQFRLAYVAPDSRAVGASDLVDHPKKIALHYLKSYFLVDLFAVFPLPQIMILFALPYHLSSSGANYAKNLLCLALLVQYIPRLCRFLPVIIDQSSSGLKFESSWPSFFINLLTFVLCGHVVGCCWYLFGLQRVNQCLRNACHSENIDHCMELIDCGHGRSETFRSFLLPNETNQLNEIWLNSTVAGNCFNVSDEGFDYGIYQKAVDIVAEPSLITRYVYSLFWGFQQISTLAGNLTPSSLVWEVLFTISIIGMGLLLFPLLLGNILNSVQAPGRRRLEMSLRLRDVKQWMSRGRLPYNLRRRVIEAERHNWAATKGVNIEMLLESLPDDLQRDIRRHLFIFLKKVRIFALMDEPILDVICERLRQKTYIKGSNILYHGGLVDKMVFVVRGRLESVGDDGIRVPLVEGDVFGEELLTWCLEYSSVSRDGKKVRLPERRLLSNRTVCCLTNVEAFALRYADLEEVTSLFTRFLRNARVQGAIRYESPYWRSLAATRIQVAWRYRKKRLGRADTSESNH
ncbi:hypothetical protein K1719_030713 [Acacia pycnantha]|nr:hypothetical protein K1719_030713 [Acacia pycnantha]